MNKTGKTWKRYRMAAIVCLIVWLLYLANKDYVETIDWYINIKYRNSLSKEGFCVVLGEMFLWLAILCGLMAVGYFVQYIKAPEVLCLACGIKYKDEIGDGVCPHCGKNRNDIQKKETRQIPQWRCSCGAIHPEYVYTCSCGKKKREGTMVEPQPLPKQVEQTKCPINNNQWQCSCGRVHREFILRCICGRQKQYTTAPDLQLGSKQAEQTKPLVNNETWQCSCGRVHPKYVSSCVCGQSRVRNEKTPENDGGDAVVANK